MTQRSVTTTTIFFPDEVSRGQGWLPSADVYRWPEDWPPYSMEIAYSRFVRVVELPCPVERMKLSAELREGMLMIYLSPEGEEG